MATATQQLKCGDFWIVIKRKPLNDVPQSVSTDIGYIYNEPNFKEQLLVETIYEKHFTRGDSISLDE